MPIAPEGWPDDAAALRAMLATQAEEMAGQKRRLEEIEAERDAHHAELLAARAGLIEQRYEIEALRARLARALRVAFGRSSEKLRDRVEQLELTLADIDELLGETATIAVETAIAPEPPDEPSKPTRRPLPERCRATSSSTLPRARALNVVVRCARSVRT